MSISAWNKRLAKAKQLHEDKQLIWWAREPFHEPKYREKIPKWHIFEDRKPVEDDKYSYTWEAKCGYTRDFNEGIMEEFPKLNLSKKAPPKELRCTKCLQQTLRVIK